MADKRALITSWKTPEILIALLGGGLLTISELQMAVGGSYTTIENRVKLLIKAGFIKDTWSGHKRILELTPKGVKTAQGLKKLSDMAGPVKQ